ncbi:MAG: 4-(cytidine 5'-diphospho)-2-C-methyl-D-erythritol kinase [Bacteroidota bacterium]|nr:4-(cytidine 5'-diphospho)-2-C-methyl-D-erythritol kinase [Bacteroidota bacterium]
MVFFPPAKLNLGLHILGKRPDGFHDLESVFLPLRWTDMLEVVIDEKVPSGKARFEWTGLDIPGNVQDNLVTKAHGLLAGKCDLPGLSIHLHKILPMGAGLGGGSADGTHALRAINEVCGLDLSKQELAKNAERLGSDCPFFLHDGPALIQGRGERITPIDLSKALDGCHVVVANPEIHIGTAEAFSNVDPQARSTDWHGLVNVPLHQWHLHLQNDFEAGVCAQHSAVEELIEVMKTSGGDHVQMTGTGSTVFGLFTDGTAAQRAWDLCKKTQQGRVWQGTL